MSRCERVDLLSINREGADHGCLFQRTKHWKPRGDGRVGAGAARDVLAAKMLDTKGANSGHPRTCGWWPGPLDVAAHPLGFLLSSHKAANGDLTKRKPWV